MSNLEADKFATLALSATGTLTHCGIQPVRPWRRKCLLHAHVLDLLREVVAKDSIAISQEVAR